MSDLPTVELSPAASRAVEAALGAGASAAEASNQRFAAVVQPSWARSVA